MVFLHTAGQRPAIPLLPTSSAIQAQSGAHPACKRFLRHQRSITGKNGYGRNSNGSHQEAVASDEPGIHPPLQGPVNQAAAFFSRKNGFPLKKYQFFCLENSMESLPVINPRLSRPDNENLLKNQEPGNYRKSYPATISGERPIHDGVPRTLIFYYIWEDAWPRDAEKPT